MAVLYIVICKWALFYFNPLNSRRLSTRQQRNRIAGLILHMRMHALSATSLSLSLNQTKPKPKTKTKTKPKPKPKPKPD